MTRLNPIFARRLGPPGVLGTLGRRVQILLLAVCCQVSGIFSGREHTIAAQLMQRYTPPTKKPSLWLGAVEDTRADQAMHNTLAMMTCQEEVEQSRMTGDH